MKSKYENTKGFHKSVLKSRRFWQAIR